MSGATRGTVVMAAACWTIAITAAVLAALGNPTAVNAVIGCSIPGSLLTYWAWGLYRQDRAAERR